MKASQEEQVETIVATKQPLLSSGATVQWVTRHLERPYVTREGDEIQVLKNGIAIWRGGKVVDVIRYSDPE